MFFGTRHSRFNVAFACAYTLAAAAMLILVHPLTLNAWECGSNPIVDLSEEVMFALWNLSTRAITTSCLMLWAYVSSQNLVEGLRADQLASALHWRLLVTWALLLTFAGAAITVKLMSWRETLTDPPDDDAGDLKEASSPNRFNGDGFQRLHDDEAGAPHSATEARHGRGCCGCGEREAARRAMRAAGCQLLLLLEKVFAWMAGCAWTDVFFPSSMPFPTPEQTLKATGLAIALTLTALATLILAGGHVAADTVERGVIESYFWVNSMSFFVGWSWVIVLRDLLALSGQAAVPTSEVQVMGRIAGLFGLESAEAVRDAEAQSFVRALAGVLLFGPVLSVLVVWGKGAALRAYGRTAGRPVTLRILALLTIATRRMQMTGDSSPSRKRRIEAASPGSRKNLALHAGLSDEHRGSAFHSARAPAPADDAPANKDAAPAGAGQAHSC